MSRRFTSGERLGLMVLAVLLAVTLGIIAAVRCSRTPAPAPAPTETPSHPAEITPTDTTPSSATKHPTSAAKRSTRANRKSTTTPPPSRRHLDDNF
jgi:hypothetical protein